MRTIIFGGSFNPVHLGHINLVLEAKEKLQADEIFLIPSGIAFFKDDYSVSVSNRLEMLHLATKNYSFIKVLPFSLNIEDGGLDLVYSVDLLVYLIDNKIVDSKPYFLIGDDLVANFDKWKNPDKIASISNLILATRNNKIDFKYKHSKLDNHVFDVSSSQIRDKIIKSENLENLLNVDVIDYIKERRLYL